MTTKISILGSGWLGQPLAQHFQALGNRVALSTRHADKQNKLRAMGFSCYLVDIDRALFSPTFFESNILIINITSKSLEGFKQLLTIIERSRIKFVLFVSSTSVYQNINRVVSEDDGVENPESMLFKIEQLFMRSAYFQTTILRFAGLIDVRRHPGRFFQTGKQISQADTPVNLIHLDDCIGLIEAIIKQQAWGEIFNGCMDSHPSKRDFYTYASSQLGYPAPICIKDEQPSYKIVSNEKVKSNLKYTFKHIDLMSINLNV